MMTLLVQGEHQTYLAQARLIGSTIVALLGQTPLLLLLSLSFDGVAWLAQRGKWTFARQNAWRLVAAMISMILVTGLMLLLSYRGGINRTLVLDLVFALLLTLPGSLLGNWLASAISESMQALRG